MVWVYIRCCIWDVCSSVMHIQAWCGDQHVSHRHPELRAWDHDLWVISVISLGKRMSIYCLQEGEWIIVLVFKRANCGSHVLPTISSFPLSGHMEGSYLLVGWGFVRSSCQWIVGGHLIASARPTRASTRMIQIVSVPKDPVQIKDKGVPPALDAQVLIC